MANDGTTSTPNTQTASTAQKTATSQPSTAQATKPKHDYYTRLKLSRERLLLIKGLHVMILAASVGLIVLISWDTFHNISFLANRDYMRVQFWICMLFILDIVVEFFLTPRKWKYVTSHIFFLLVSIPYLNIISYYQIDLSAEMQYLVRFIPMIRAGYVLALVLGVLFSNKISGLFATYIGLLIATVYFASLMFFIEEHYVNPGVTTYWSALWWAFMDVTTVGCNINCITPTGKVLGVVLSAEGLILFPIFTVYITNSLSRRKLKDRQLDGAQAA